MITISSPGQSSKLQRPWPSRLGSFYQMLEFKTFPDWDVHEFVADRFPTPLKKDEIPERYNSTDNMEEEPDTLPF